MSEDHPLPQTGGSFVRQADGTLIAAEAAAEAAPVAAVAEPEAEKPAPVSPRGKAAAEKE